MGLDAEVVGLELKQPGRFAKQARLGFLGCPALKPLLVGEDSSDVGLVVKAIDLLELGNVDLLRLLKPGGGLLIEPHRLLRKFASFLTEAGLFFWGSGICRTGRDDRQYDGDDDGTNRAHGAHPPLSPDAWMAAILVLSRISDYGQN